MSGYTTLPVYVDAYNMLKYYYEMSSHISRDMRYTIGSDLASQMFEMITDIYNANRLKGDNKITHIEKALYHLVKVRLHIRLLHDLKQLSDGQMAVFIDSETRLEKQLDNWLKYRQKGKAEI